jgi:RecJ-like exonuclease
MKDDARRLAQILLGRKRVRVVTHIDADGICAGAIASMALDRAGIGCDVEFVKQLDPETVEKLKTGQPGSRATGQPGGNPDDLSTGHHEAGMASPEGSGTRPPAPGTRPPAPDTRPPAPGTRPPAPGTLHPAPGTRPPAPGTLIWFTDLGSGQLEMLKGIDCVISDHHTPSGESSIPSVNPHLDRLSGANELSGAGAAYMVAREMGGANRDLAALAIVGAVGDMQDGQECRLTGLNRDVMDDGRAAGVLEWAVDLRFFGRETRPVHKMLQYSSDPAIPGITGSEDGALSFLVSLGIPLKDGEQWRSWSMLEFEERRKVASALVRRALAEGVGSRMARRMLGEVYILSAETAGTELRDAKEYATLLNSCGRHDKAALGLAVCRGDRQVALARAQSLLQGHRRSLVEAIQYVKEVGIEKRGLLQHFHAGTAIQDTIVGVVAGMLLGSGEAGADPSLPMMAFAVSEDGRGVKVSARAARALVERGLDLSAVMKAATASVGGTGGGHNVAAGGMIPEGAEERFLQAAEQIIRAQMAAGR